MQETPDARSRIDRLQRALEGHDGWKLKVIWASTKTAPADVGIQSDAAISKRIQQMRTIADGYGELALLLGWATLEALGRRLAPSLIEKPQSPGKLVERLAGDGLITPNEADWLREISKVRNQFIHGELSVEVSAEKILRFVEILEGLENQTTS